MNNLQIDLLAFDLAQGRTYRFCGALDIRLQNDLQLLPAIPDRVKQAFQGGPLRHGQFLTTELHQSLFAQGPGRPFRLHFQELITSVGEAGKSQNPDGGGGPGFLNILAGVGNQRFYFAPIVPADKRLADLYGAHSDNHGGGWPSSWLDLRLDDRRARRDRRAGFEFHDFCLQKHHLKKLVQAGAFGRGYRAANGLATPVFRSEAALLELLLDTIDVGGW